MEETRALVEMSDDEVIDTLQSLVFGSYGRTTPKERYAVSRAIDLINTLMLQKDLDDKAYDIFKQLGIKTEKGRAIIFDKTPTDEDFMKVQELINK